jgi:hypothetical protein
MMTAKSAPLSASLSATLFAIASSLMVVGCGSMNAPSMNVTTGAGGSSTSGTGGAITTGAGGATSGGTGGATSGGDTLCGNVTLSTTRTVAAGQTLTICAGSVVTSADGVSLAVDGTLQIQGTAASPVKLIGATDAAGAWTGLVLDAGGQVTATYVEIHGADTAIAARPGSMYSFDHVVIDTSSQELVLSSSGTIAHGTLRGLGDSQYGSPVLINNASPQITNTSITQALFGGVDMVVVGGASSAPLFDHVEVADSHCAFHINQSTGATITNSFIHHNAYGFMVIDSQSGHFNHNNWEDNEVNLGTCESGIADEVADNYFQGVAFGDGTCAASLAVTGTTPAAPYATGIGPQP